jgi:hypothetical protein
MLKTLLITTGVSGVIHFGRDCLVRNANRAASERPISGAERIDLCVGS